MFVGAPQRWAWRRLSGYREFLLANALIDRDWAAAEHLVHGIDSEPSLLPQPQAVPTPKHVTYIPNYTPSPAPKQVPCPPRCPHGSRRASPPLSLDCLPLGLPSVLYFALRSDAGVVRWLLDHGARIDIGSVLFLGLTNYDPKRIADPKQKPLLSDPYLLTVPMAVVLSRNNALASLVFSRYRFAEEYFTSPYALLGNLAWLERWFVKGSTPEMEKIVADAERNLPPKHCASNWHCRRLLYVAKLKDSETHIHALPWDLLRKIDGYLHHLRNLNWAADMRLWRTGLIRYEDMRPPVRCAFGVM